MDTIRTIDQFLEKIEKMIISLSVIAMSIILIGNVISRSVFNNSWTFAEEVGQFLIIAITFIGISYAARRNSHISMSALYDLLPPKMKRLLMLIISSFTSVTLYYLAYIATKYTIRVYELGKVTPALRVPMYLIIMIIPIGFLLGGIQYTRNALETIKEKQNSAEIPQKINKKNKKNSSNHLRNIHHAVSEDEYEKEQKALY